VLGLPSSNLWTPASAGGTSRRYWGHSGRSKKRRKRGSGRGAMEDQGSASAALRSAGRWTPEAPTPSPSVITRRRQALGAVAG
jgi:hypothetical protein